MGVLKTAFTLASKSANFHMAHGRTRLLACAPIFVGLQRDAHSQEITKNMQYISNDKVNLQLQPETMKLGNAQGKPLCLMLNWMLARQKHIMKYASVYLERGYDVLSVSCTPWQLLWPMKGTQLVAADLLRFMKNNECFPALTIHGFSVGAYLWGEVLMHISKNKQMYLPVLDRVRAQVWDSAVDISELTIGVPNAVFPKNKVMNATLKKYLEYHLRHFHEQATVHYMRSSQMFHVNTCRAPALVFVSRVDPVGSEEANTKVCDSWAELGIKITYKCFEKSPHVQHFTRYREEYLAALLAHLQQVSQADRISARI